MRPESPARSILLLGSSARTASLARRLAKYSVRTIARLEELAATAPAELLIVWPESLAASAATLAATLGSGGSHGRILGCLSAAAAAQPEAWLCEAYDDVVSDEDEQIERRVVASGWLARAGTGASAARRAFAFADQLIDTVSAMVVVMDRAGRILTFNRACEKATGYRAAEVVGHTVFERLLRPEDVPAVRGVFAALAAGDFPSSHDNHWVAKDGSLRWIHWDNTARVDADGAVEQVVGTGIDLTENVALARALDRSEARLRDWIKHLPDAVFVTRGHTICFVNDALLTTLGWRAEDMNGAPLGRLVGFDQVAALVRSGSELLHEGDAHPPRDLHLIDASGREVPTEVVAMRTVFDGAPAIMCVARDLTARHELTTRMFQIDRTMMLGSVAAGIGHEINNPLAFVVGNLELASASLHDLATAESVPATVRAELLEQSRGLADALQGAQTIAAVVRDLKRLARSSEDTRASVALEPVLDYLVKVAGHEIKHRARVVRVYAGVPRVVGSEVRVAQIFVNLLLNAAQAIAPGDAEHQTITLRTSADAAFVQVEVSDTGSGMTKELVSRIFEPFLTTKAGAGSGLGLSITRQIVLSLGGTLTVESLPGAGSTFCVRLPIAPARAEPSIDSASSAPLAPSSRARVLAIDDEAQVSEVLARLLRSQHDVTSVTSGVAALELLMSDAPLPDVVFCDVMMPAMTGIELYEEIERQRPELARRFVFMTGGTFTPESAPFLERADRPVVTKPFDRSALLAVIAAVRAAGER